MGCTASLRGPGLLSAGVPVILSEVLPAEIRRLDAARATHMNRVGSTVVLALFVLPALAIPAYVIGHSIVGAVDNDPTDGELELGLALGVLLPSMTSILLARRWGDLKWIPALTLGIGSGVGSLVVLSIAFVVFCSATNCIV